MHSYYPERFERDMGTSETEWLTALPRALGHHAFVLGPGQVRVQIGEGHLQLHPAATRDRAAAPAAFGGLFCVRGRGRRSAPALHEAL
jgi:hypothetical protein